MNKSNMKTLEGWAERFERRHPGANIDVTDDIVVSFNLSDDTKSFEIMVSNEEPYKLKIHRVNINVEEVKLRNPYIEGIEIRPNRELALVFDVERCEEEIDKVARVIIHFNGFIITRSIKIEYHDKSVRVRKKNNAILRRHYKIPREFVDILKVFETYEDQMQALDGLIPATDDLEFKTYAEYFHGLLYLEQLGMVQSFKVYNRREVYFRKSKNSKIKFEMEIEDLFETRPSLSVGDSIFARKNIAPMIEYKGMVNELKEDLVIVIFEDNFINDFNHEGYRVEFAFNPMVFVRAHRTVDLACEMFDREYLFPNKIIEARGVQMDVALNKHQELSNGAKISLPWFNDKLNFYQKQAVVQTLRAKCPMMPYIIYGPPGTGKTTTLTEIALQLHTNIKNSRILIAAQSNSAANLLAQRLITFGKLPTSKLLRLTSLSYSKGDRMPEDLIDYSAVLCLNRSPNEDEDSDDSLMKIARIYDADFLIGYPIIIGTAGSMTALVECSKINYSFTHAIIDDAGQCTEVDALIPMLMVGKDGQIIMAGDPKQMTPIVCSHLARDRGLTKSIMCRLLEHYEKLEDKMGFMQLGNDEEFSPKLVTKLRYNYRSLPSILGFVNFTFYNFELRPMVPLDGYEASTLESLMMKGVIPKNENMHGLYFFDVNGRNKKCGTTSWCNCEEAYQIDNLVEKLIKCGIDEADIGIISPYYLQVRMLKNMLEDKPKITVGTVEEFQGQERLIILLSTVRTCEIDAEKDVARHLGFVHCPKRLNVAVSRAKSLFYVFGKANLLSIDPNWKDLIDGCKDNGTFLQQPDF